MYLGGSTAMSEIKNAGVPNKHTVGALGDIYIDTATGLKYKCTGATTIAGQSDYEWTRVVTPYAKPEVKLEQKPVVKEEPKQVVKEEKMEAVPVEIKPEVKSVASEETTPIKTPKQPKRDRTDYNKQYNNKK